MQLDGKNREWLLNAWRGGNGAAMGTKDRGAPQRVEALLLYRDQLEAELVAVDQELRSLARNAL